MSTIKLQRYVKQIAMRTCVTVLISIRVTAANTVRVGGRLKQGNKLFVALAVEGPSVRVHLSTIVFWIQLPDCRVHAAGDLNVVFGLFEIGGQDEAFGHGVAVSHELAMTVSLGAPFMGSNVLATIAGHH